ncbi:MAG TPA: hypothetical protein PLQ36_03275, partial [Candidatus Gracilibacteria bacterium]|nr:hypothetical protein [Candidatus Gracilibacteria bacterium]
SYKANNGETITVKITSAQLKQYEKQQISAKKSAPKKTVKPVNRSIKAAEVSSLSEKINAKFDSLEVGTPFETSLKLSGKNYFKGLDQDGLNLKVRKNKDGTYTVFGTPDKDGIYNITINNQSVNVPVKAVVRDKPVSEPVVASVDTVVVTSPDTLAQPKRIQLETLDLDLNSSWEGKIYDDSLEIDTIYTNDFPVDSLKIDNSRGHTRMQLNNPGRAGEFGITIKAKNLNNQEKIILNQRVNILAKEENNFKAKPEIGVINANRSDNSPWGVSAGAKIHNKDTELSIRADIDEITMSNLAGKIDLVHLFKSQNEKLVKVDSTFITNKKAIKVNELVAMDSTLSVAKVWQALYGEELLASDSAAVDSLYRKLGETSLSVSTWQKLENQLGITIVDQKRYNQAFFRTTGERTLFKDERLRTTVGVKSNGFEGRFTHQILNEKVKTPWGDKTILENGLKASLEKTFNTDPKQTLKAELGANYYGKDDIAKFQDNQFEYQVDLEGTSQMSVGGEYGIGAKDWKVSGGIAHQNIHQGSETYQATEYSLGASVNTPIGDLKAKAQVTAKDNYTV